MCLKGTAPSEPHYSGNVKHKKNIYTVYPTTTWEQEDIMGQSKWKRIRVCLPSKDRKVSSCVPSSTGLCARSTNSALVVMCEAYKHRDGNLRWRCIPTWLYFVKFYFHLFGHIHHSCTIDSSISVLLVITDVYVLGDKVANKNSSSVIQFVGLNNC